MTYGVTLDQGSTHGERVTYYGLRLENILVDIDELVLVIFRKHRKLLAQSRGVVVLTLVGVSTEILH